MRNIIDERDEREREREREREKTINTTTQYIKKIFF
jgi:hypothetical protein